MGGGGNEIEETEEQKASARVAMEKWKMYQSEFKPYEQKYFNKVERMGGEAQMGQVTRMADRAVSSQYSSAINNAGAGMASKNINPNSGLFQKEIGMLEQQKAKSRADAMSKTQLDQQGRFVSGLKSIAQMGQGQSVDAVRGLGDVAQSANSYARHSASMSTQDTISNNNLVGAGIGAGLNYYIEGNQP
jgi:hypothetical protein